MESANNNIYNYQKEKKLQYKLKDELIFITQKSLQDTIEKFDGFIDKLGNIYIQKKWPLFQEYCKKNLSKEESEEKEEEEKKKLEESLKNLKQLIKNDLESSCNENTKDLINKIDDIFEVSNLNPNIKKINNQIINNEYSSEKLDEILNESVKKYEDTYRNFLLKKMKYKEELEIYNLRQTQILNENIDTKKEYNDINNFINNYKANTNNVNDDYKKLKKLTLTVSEFNMKKMNNQ